MKAISWGGGGGGGGSALLKVPNIVSATYMVSHSLYKLQACKQVDIDILFIVYAHIMESEV